MNRLGVICFLTATIVAIWFATSNSHLFVFCLLTEAAKVGGSGGSSGGGVGGNTDWMYGSSLYRSGKLLKNVAELTRLEEVNQVHHCLLQCIILKPACRAFNYSPNGSCILLAESLCSNETYELSEDENFNYYDLMLSPDYELKHLDDQYCLVYGKCSGQCYPRKPLFVEKTMTRAEAVQYCAKFGRKLAQPKSQTENIFYGEFGRKSYRKIMEQETSLELANSINKTNKVNNSNNKGSAMERLFKEAKYWIGITDEEVEGFWIYDDGSPVSEFSAWAVSQPDNGGSAFGAQAENCAAIELREYNWIDIECDNKLHFFCA